MSNNVKKITLAIMLNTLLLTSFNAMSVEHGQSDIARNYLNPKTGSTITQISNTDDFSRWYATWRVKGGYKNIDKTHSEYVQLNGRLRGKTYFSDTTAFVGDFWFRAVETYSRQNGRTVNNYNDFDEKTKWEQYRIGFEDDNLGSLIYGKHTATWSFFAVDTGANSLYRNQADAAAKNAGKFIYKKHFANNLFLNGSFDRNSHVWGADIGYQTDDLYSFKPGMYGVYASIHNGQPMMAAGSKTVYGNVDITKTRNANLTNSDTNYARESNSLYTYALSGYKNFGRKTRLGFQTAYSKIDSQDSRGAIRNRGYTKGGLGYSANVVGQIFPDNYKGVSYILNSSWDEIFGTSVTPQIEYMFKPSMRVWVAYTIEEKEDNTIFLEGQWDF